MITTLEFGAFNHLINIQKVLDLFDDNVGGDGDGDDYGDDDDPLGPPLHTVTLMFW